MHMFFISMRSSQFFSLALLQICCNMYAVFQMEISTTDLIIRWLQNYPRGTVYVGCEQIGAHAVVVVGCLKGSFIRNHLVLVIALCLPVAKHQQQI